jgi:fibrillarin-like rRNA methylase
MAVQNQDFEFFLQNMEGFYKTYGQKFVAVKNQSILGSYDSFNEALDTTLKTEELGTFLIQEIFEDEEKMVHYFQSNVMPVPA